MQSVMGYFAVAVFLLIMSIAEGQHFISSFKPSFRPTAVPTGAPTITFCPSAVPTETPSAAPSFSYPPTIAPSMPTSVPSAAPSDVFGKIFSDDKRLAEDKLPKFSQAAIGLGLAAFVLLSFFIYFYFCRPPPPPNSDELLKRKKSMLRKEAVANKNAQYASKMKSTPSALMDELGLGFETVSVPAPKPAITSKVAPTSSRGSSSASSRKRGSTEEQIIKLDLEEYAEDRI